jgi:hypothetical protein
MRVGPAEIYREQLWRAWSQTPAPVIAEIPANRAQLLARVSGGDSFDGGRTAAWLTAGDIEYRAVRDERTGHTIHVATDRAAYNKELTADLRLGLRLLAWMSRGAPIVWFWWDQPWERQLPAWEDPGREHVNGGWAVPGVREVHVYRREEAHKVMLHETVHALGLDVPHETVEPVRRQFEVALGRRLWPHLGEAFTELLAAWLWSIARADSVADAKRLWNHQVACSRGQAARVWARIHDATEAEDTNVFAYYVLKWVLMRSHLAEVLVGADHSVRKWFAWFQAERPLLDAAAAAEADTVDDPMRMGMTCATGR